MAKPYKRLLAHWRSQGLKDGGGVSKRELLEFEQLNGVSLPSDFRDYLVYTNGMQQDLKNCEDSLGFAFWPLHRIRRVSEWVAAHSPAWPSFPGCEDFFVFADYLQLSWAFSICLTPKGGVGTNCIATVGMLETQTPAGSFEEFINLYLIDSPKLYPATESTSTAAQF